MSTNFAIIGGDLRIIKLAQMLAKDGNKIFTYGLEKAEGLNKDNIKLCSSLNEAIENSEVIIGPIPFSNNAKEINNPFSDENISIKNIIHNANGRILIAGAIGENVYEMQKNEDEECLEIVDVMKKEELAVLNTISTAEGTIELMIENTNKIIHGAKVLILGFGRVAKTLADKLSALSLEVTCAARKDEDIAWIKTYGYQAININELEKNQLDKYDFIINTVPQLIVTKEIIKRLKKDCLIIDLASKPGGIDREEAKKESKKYIWALALPGKVAPSTTAQIIKETVYNILRKR